MGLRSLYINIVFFEFDFRRKNLTSEVVPLTGRVKVNIIFSILNSILYSLINSIFI